MPATHDNDKNYKSLKHDFKHRYFWVMWANNLIEVGSGMVPGSGRYTAYQDTKQILFTGVSVASVMGQDASWMFTRNAGMVVWKM